MASLVQSATLIHFFFLYADDALFTTLIEQRLPESIPPEPVQILLRISAHATHH